MSVMDICLEVIRIPLQWFSYLLEKTGLTFIYVGMVLIFVVFRLTIAPIVGRGISLGSDFARKPNSSSDGGHVLDSTGYDAMYFDDDGEMWG